MQSNQTLNAKDLLPAVERTLELASEKTLRLDRRWKASDGAPVITVAGRYTARSWTQWTQGFQYGNALLCFELTGDQDLLTAARRHVVADMAEHLTHTGVHDHGFNNISTYGNLRRLMLEGRIPTERLGAALLRARVEGKRRGAGRALDQPQGWPRLHLLL